MQLTLPSAKCKVPLKRWLGWCLEATHCAKTCRNIQYHVHDTRASGPTKNMFAGIWAVRTDGWPSGEQRRSLSRAAALDPKCVPNMYRMHMEQHALPQGLQAFQKPQSHCLTTPTKNLCALDRPKQSWTLLAGWVSFDLSVDQLQARHCSLPQPMSSLAITRACTNGTVSKSPAFNL